MSSSLGVKANCNLLDAEKPEDFKHLLARALNATVDQLNGGELTVKDIFTQVHGKMRARYIDLRKSGTPHKEAVRQTNREASKADRAMVYGKGGW